MDKPLGKFSALRIMSKTEENKIRRKIKAILAKTKNAREKRICRNILKLLDLMDTIEQDINEWSKED